MYVIYPPWARGAVKSTKEIMKVSCEFLKSLLSEYEFFGPQHELSELQLVTVEGC